MSSAILCLRDQGVEMGRIRGGVRDQGVEMCMIRGGVRDQGRRWVGLGVGLGIRGWR